MFISFSNRGDRRRPGSSLVDRAVAPRDGRDENGHGQRHSWQRLQRPGSAQDVMLVYVSYNGGIIVVLYPLVN